MTDSKMTPTINEFANYYEFRGDYDHTPTDGERTMIEDAITGYLEDTGLAQALSTLEAERDRLRAEKGEWSRIQIGNGLEIGRHIVVLATIQRLARQLLDACYDADAREELDMGIDGSLLDDLAKWVPKDAELYGKLSGVPALNPTGVGEAG